jgi:signal transduction histidine kinase
MIRYLAFPFFIFFVNVGQAQVRTNCHDAKCKVADAIRRTERYLETDHLEDAQQWLTEAKKQNRIARNETFGYLIHSLQSELFYYWGLYQFGKHEADKGIDRATALRDSVLVADAYFFRGINLFEMREDAAALWSLRRAAKIFPVRPREHIRTIIAKSHIYNNIAQVKLRLGENDSAVFYNKAAYVLAQKHRNARVIANAEQTFGLVYAAQKKQDSARYFLRQSIASAKQYGYDDIALLDMGYLMNALSDSRQIAATYEEGRQLIQSRAVNALFKKYFFIEALRAFGTANDQMRTVQLQADLIAINEAINRQENQYIQRITDDYMQSENRLLQSQISALHQSQRTTAWQLTAALLCVMVLFFAVVTVRRKNRLQKSLLDQKNEISKDLHDDIGSELSSILIHTDLLMSNYDANERQKALLSKIGQTGREISERLNAFIWSLNIENNSVGSFSEYVGQYGTKFFDGTAIAFDFSSGVAHPGQSLNGYIRKNLFFCVKEALNNALKHSGASRVSLSIAADGRQIEIAISDDGSGASTVNTFGNGIKNMQRRMALLKGKMDMAPETGYTVSFTVPIP